MFIWCAFYKVFYGINLCISFVPRSSTNYRDKYVYFCLSDDDENAVQLVPHCVSTGRKCVVPFSAQLKLPLSSGKG